MASSARSVRPHFVLVPLMCPGHLLPMVDMARLLAQHGAIVTFVTTPLNVIRVRSMIDLALNSGLPIEILSLKFPGADFGLPRGCESIDDLPSVELNKNFFLAAKMLRDPLEKSLAMMNPSPLCVISDSNLPWTDDVARKLCIPRILFEGTSCFTHLCNHNIYLSVLHKDSMLVNGDSSDVIVVPGMPGEVKFRKSQLPGIFKPGQDRDWMDIRKEIRESNERAYGVIANTFEEIESEYVEAYKEVVGSDRVWCVGPLSLCNEGETEKAERGDRKDVARDENVVETLMSWLNSQAYGSVIYVCLGSLNRVSPQQLKELGLGLESSGRPFVWVIRRANGVEDFEEWLRGDGFEERVRGTGLLIRGWAPQVLILSHRAIGGFLTHCGWNSTLEGMSAGVPMVTWPLFGDQFYNERTTVDVLRVGVRVGDIAEREEVRRAVEGVMDEGEGIELRRRVNEVKEMAIKAMEEGGSSYNNVQTFIEHIQRL